MNDTFKIMLGSMAGFLFGLLAEPLKLQVQQSVKKARLRKALYGNLAYHCGQCYQFSVLFRDKQISAKIRCQKAAEILERIDLDVFEHYYQSEKSTFWKFVIAGDSENSFSFFVVR